MGAGAVWKLFGVLIVVSLGNLCIAGSARSVQQVGGQSRILRFSVCNGYTNQRLALIYGFLVAHLSERDVILPRLIRDGTQMSTEIVTASEGNFANFGTFYDVSHLKTTLENFITVVPDPNIDHDQYTPLHNPMDAISSNARAVDIGCPMFRLPSDVLAKHADVVWRILESLQPSRVLRTLVKKITDGLSRPFTFLHLRSERDWKQHCKKWTFQSRLNNNCYNNTVIIGNILRGMGVPQNETVYVATSLRDSTADTNIALSNLKRKGYRIKLQSASRLLSRELMAAVNYYVAMVADHFVGNSVSTRTAGVQRID
jgi:hypothetical protein